MKDWIELFQWALNEEFRVAEQKGIKYGDAKYFIMVKGVSIPPVKFSVIAEHVWLLEKTSAKHKFLVFGKRPQSSTRVA